MLLVGDRASVAVRAVWSCGWSLLELWLEFFIAIERLLRQGAVGASVAVGAVAVELLVVLFCFSFML